jgi:cell division protein FtsW (lipid II flippase)
MGTLVGSQSLFGMVIVSVFILVFILARASVVWRWWVRGAFFLFGLQVLLNSVHDVPKSGDVETNMDFTVSRCNQVGFDYVRDI